jgi:hypothetical protein
MADTNITNAETGNQRNTFVSYTVDAMATGGSDGQKEFRYQNTDWTRQYALYKTIPEMRITIDAKSTWTIGKGFKSNEITTMALSQIKGNGKDTFNSIIANQIRVRDIGGNSYAHIIRDDEGNLVNLKPLDPSTIIEITNSSGHIIRYEQTSKIRGKHTQKFSPKEIFHLSRNRTADDHGSSMVDAVEWIILARNEAMTDYRTLLHRNIYPVRIWHLDTDVPAKVAAFKAKVANAKYLGEDIFIPKGAVETETASIAPNATLDPKAWINQLNNYFFQETGVPQVIVGGSMGMTDAAVKIEYLAFEQTIENEQLYIEDQVLSQLNLEINLEFPASLQNELISDQSKSETMQASTPEDTGITSASGILGGVAK